MEEALLLSVFCRVKVKSACLVIRFQLLPVLCPPTSHWPKQMLGISGAGKTRAGRVTGKGGVLASESTTTASLPAGLPAGAWDRERGNTRGPGAPPGRPGARPVLRLSNPMSSWVGLLSVQVILDCFPVPWDVKNVNRYGQPQIRTVNAWSHRIWCLTKGATGERSEAAPGWKNQPRRSHSPDPTRPCRQNSVSQRHWEAESIHVQTKGRVPLKKCPEPVQHLGPGRGS